MQTKPSQSASRGLTISEIVFILSALFILMVLFLPRSPARTKSTRIACVNNLKQIGLAFRMWSNESGERFPWAVSATNVAGGTLEIAESGQTWRHFTAVSNELSSPKVMACPNDTRLRAFAWAEVNDNKSLSYFAGLDADETRPQTILSGDRNLRSTTSLTNGILRLTGATPVEWTDAIHRSQGNIALADGSVQQTANSSLNKQIQAALSTDPNRLVIRLALPQ